MPFGSKKKGAKAILEDVERTNGFEFTRDFILPSELGEQKKLLEKVYKNNVGYYKLNDEERKNEAVKMEDLLAKMTEKLKEYDGSIQSYVGSSGGSISENNIQENKSNTDYIVIKINNVLIFEPFGQVNNATFIGNAENENLKEELKDIGRIKSVENELLGRIMHVRTENGTYNYENGHILEIMELAHEYPDDFLSTTFEIMKSQKGCFLSTIDSKIPNFKKDAGEKIGKQVRGRNISSKDVTDAASKILGVKEKENTENEMEGVEK